MNTDGDMNSSSDTISCDTNSSDTNSSDTISCDTNSSDTNSSSDDKNSSGRQEPERTNDADAAEKKGEIDQASGAEQGLLASAEEIGLHDVDGNDKNYSFRYDGKEFKVQYIYDNWTIIDSYRIVNEDDMKIICQALLDTHPIHGHDMKSYRTAADMVYEWKQHNLAYFLLPENDRWRDDAKDVGFDPADQGRSFKEIYENRTGKKLGL